MKQFEELRHKIDPIRTELLNHRLYWMINSLASLRVFMEHHVFAVWDFMSLLKSLQRSHTAVDLPWRPKSEGIVPRFINEIVLGEESDEDGNGGYASHFEIYRRAMYECGASTERIDKLIKCQDGGMDIDQALRQSQAPDCVVRFVRTTWSFVASGSPHRIAGAFTLGREDVIPEMFRNCVAALGKRPESGLEIFKYYLARHIEMDENHHAPMARRVMIELCGQDGRLWEEALDAVVTAIRARITFWDEIATAIHGSNVPDQALSGGERCLVHRVANFSEGRE